MAVQTGGVLKAATGTPIQCLDCSMFLGSSIVGGRCRNHPLGIPSEKRQSLCLQHEYRLRFR